MTRLEIGQNQIPGYVDFDKFKLFTFLLGKHIHCYSYIQYKLYPKHMHFHSSPSVFSNSNLHTWVASLNVHVDSYHPFFLPQWPSSGTNKYFRICTKIFAASNICQEVQTICAWLNENLNMGGLGFVPILYLGISVSCWWIFYNDTWLTKPG